MKERKEIEEKYKLNTRELFDSPNDFYKELESLKEEIKELAKYEGHLLDNADTLYEAINLSENLEKKIERVYIYAHLTNDFDLSDELGNEYFGKAFKLYQSMVVCASFMTPELLESDYSVIEKYIKEKKELKTYENLLKEVYRTKAHILSKKEEEILSQMDELASAPENAYGKLVDVDLKFESVEDDEGKIIELNEITHKVLMESKNREVRKNTFKTFYKGYQSIINTTSELLSACVKKNNKIAQIRNYESAISASLDANNVTKKVYDTLLKAIDENLQVIYRQWKIRKKALKLEELHLYDTTVSLVKDYEKKYSYKEATSLIKDALQVLGEEYSNVLARAFDEQWIDVFPNKNKRSGAYCTCCYETHPYVLTNFNERYGDVATLAHELGHAMHYYYAAKNNNYCDYNYTIFVAEVASQVNEALLAMHILKNSNNKEEKLFVLDELIKHFKSSVVRQTMFAEFESIIHEEEQKGEVLTNNSLCDIYYNLNKKYYGEEIIVDEEIKYEWSRVPHFYYNFYVYQYATGYVAALKIASDILNQKEHALENYIKFLRVGTTLNPVESLKVAGVDLTDPQTFNDAFKEFNREMDEFECLLEEEENHE